MLFVTDGLIEEHVRGGVEFGHTGLRGAIARVEADVVPVQESARRLSRVLMLERGGATTDDSTLVMLEWRGAPADDLASPDHDADAS